MRFLSVRCFYITIFLLVSLMGCAGVDSLEVTTSSRLPVTPARTYGVAGMAQDRVGNMSEPSASSAGLTMQMAVQQATGWHPSLNEAAGGVRESREKIAEAKAGYLPGVSAGIRSGYGSRRYGSPATKFQLNARQVLFDFGKIAGSVQAERAGQTLSSARLLSATDQLVRDTALAVVEVQRNKRLKEVSQRQINGIAGIVKLVNERTVRGASTDSDRIQAASRLEAARTTRLQYEAAYRQELAKLGYFLGREVVPADEIPDWLPQACNVSSPDWNAVPAMQVAQAQHQRASAQLKRSRAEAFPTFSLEANAVYDLDDSRGRDDHDIEYSVGLNVSSPIYQGGATGARLSAAGHALESANFARDNARVAAVSQFNQARQQVNSLQQLQQSLINRTRLMVKTRDLYRMQYADLGTRTLLNLLDAEKELHEAELLAVNAEHNLKRLYVTCLYNSGKTRERFGINAFALHPGLSEQ